jgi:hypothetical protein
VAITTYLDSSGHKWPFESDWSRSQRRLYHRSLSGVEFHRRRGHRLRFMTLTSGPDSPEDLHHSFRVLVKRIRRKFEVFEYVSVREWNERGDLTHIHLIYWGRYIPFKWLKAVWEEVHKAKSVYIQDASRWKKKRLASYLVKYLVKAPFGRFFYSWRWLWRGFVQDWRALQWKYGPQALGIWHMKLVFWTPKVPFRVLLLDGLIFGTPSLKAPH